MDFSGLEGFNFGPPPGVCPVCHGRGLQDRISNKGGVNSRYAVPCPAKCEHFKALLAQYLDKQDPRLTAIRLAALSNSGAFQPQEPGRKSVPPGSNPQSSP